MADPLTWTEIQTALKAATLFTGAVNGTPGPDSWKAVDACLTREILAARIAPGWEGWPDARRQIAVEQVILRDAGNEVGTIDGLVGPQTRFARDAYRHKQATGQPLILPERSVSPAAASGPSTWPRQADCEAFYGKVGENQVVLTLPYAMKLAWDPNAVVRRFTCHAKVHDAFLRVFQNTLAQYGTAKIHDLRLDLFGGCLNVRKMRGGTDWSMHSWGIAVDLDPDHNQLNMNHTVAGFARSDYDPFWKIVEAEGLLSLGRARDFDWMHFQAARL